MPSLSDAIAAACTAARTAGVGAAGAKWEFQVRARVREPLTESAMHYVNQRVARSGLLPSQTTVGAVQRAVNDHLQAIVDYRHLIDGVAYRDGQDGLDRVLATDRATRVAETEERHLHSAIVVMLAAGGR